MIPLKTFADPWYYYDPTFLDLIDVPILLISIILMFIAYRKIKSYKGTSSDVDMSSLKEEPPFLIEPRDVLMQPKKYGHNFKIPFINFSLKKVYVFIGLIFLIYILNIIMNYEIDQRVDW
tara:strand:+ start:189 stop:548 length:360 start_codon:yes stop_codon:yes gene_type:complete